MARTPKYESNTGGRRGRPAQNEGSSGGGRGNQGSGSGTSVRLPSELSGALEHLNVQQLGAVISRAEAMLEEKTHDERRAFLEEVRARAAGLGMSIDELLGGSGAGGRSTGARGNTGRGGTSRGGGSGSSAPALTSTGKVDRRRSPPAKYRGPNGELWSGRGRAPRWLAGLLQQGHTKEDYLIR